MKAVQRFLKGKTTIHKASASSDSDNNFSVCVFGSNAISFLCNHSSREENTIAEQNGYFYKKTLRINNTDISLELNTSLSSNSLEKDKIDNFAIINSKGFIITIDMTDKDSLEPAGKIIQEIKRTEELYGKKPIILVGWKHKERKQEITQHAIKSFLEHHGLSYYEETQGKQSDALDKIARALKGWDITIHVPPNLGDTSVEKGKGKGKATTHSLS